MVDDGYVTDALADRFLFDLRFGRDRAESTSRAYAGELAEFLAWCQRIGRSLEQGARPGRHGSTTSFPRCMSNALYEQWNEKSR